MPAGRPSDYTQELADKICAKIAQGKSLRTICLDEYLPGCATIFNWLRTKKEFLEQYERAKEAGSEAMAEDILDFSDDALNLAQNVDPKAAGAVVQAARLQVDTRKWLMSKMKMKKYGDKLDMTTNGKDLPIPILAPAVPTNYVHRNNSDTENNDNAEKNPGSAGGNVSEQNNIDHPILDTLSTER